MAMNGAIDRSDRSSGSAHERLLTEIVRSLPVATAVAGYDDRILFFNDKFIRLLGYTTEDLPTLSAAWPKVYPDPQYRAQVMQQWMTAIEAMQASGGEFVLQCFQATRKDGSLREIEFRYQPLDEHYIVVAEDVTERKRAEAELLALEERFVKAFRASPSAINITRLSDGKLIEVNDRWTELCGYTRDEAIGRTIAELEIELRDRAYQELLRLDGRLRDLEVGYRIRRGEWRVALCSAEQIELQGQPCLLWTSQDITARKLIEAALRESDANFRTLVMHSSVALAMGDESGNILLLNDRFIATFGYTLEDIRTLEDWWPRAYPNEAYRRQVRTTWEAAVNEARITGQELKPQEWRVVCKDGTLRDVEFRLAFLTNRHIFVLNDITERKQAEARLQRSETLFRSLTESSQAAIFLSQADRFIYANPAAEAVTGYGAEEIVTKRLWDVIHPESHAGVKERMRARARGERVAPRHEVKIRTKQGAERWVDYSIGLIETDGQPTAILTAFDSTERKQAETALRLSEERFSRVFRESGTPMGVVRLRDGCVLEANAAWGASVGLDPQAVIGRTSEDIGLYFSGIEPSSLVSRLVAGEAVRDVEVRMHLKQGGAPIERIILISGVPIVFDGEPCVLWGHQDITALKQTEAELRASREQLRNLAARLQTLREENRAHFAREIHDELGQALTSLKMELRWLDRMLADEPQNARGKVASMLDLVSATINNVRRIATELRPGILDDFGLVAALEWQTQEFAARTGLACRLVNQTGDEDDLPLDRDQATALFRIVQESLTNVARHAGASRTIVRLTRTGDRLILKVRDNGRGITSAESGNVRSLGLLGMRERAQMFGGSFDIHGEPGKGTTVTLRMPLEAANEGNSNGQNSDR
jgi:PAS domain S-box-containing protein